MKVIYVKSCENCPNVRKLAISVYCVLNDTQNQLALDYSIPEWCPLDEYIESDKRQLPDYVLNADVLFGLKKQGHLPTIEKMLAENKSWEEIGKVIGWDLATAKEHYGWYKDTTAD